MSIYLVSPPDRCNSRFKYEDKDYAAIVDPGYPGVSGGPPDFWEPPEPGYIEEFFAFEEGIGWVSMGDNEEETQHLEDAAWQGFNCWPNSHNEQ